MNIFQDWFQGIAVTITSFFIVVTSILPWSTTGINKPTDTSIATSSATASESASPSPSITATPAPKVKATVKNPTTHTPAPVIIEAQPTVLPQIKEAQKPKIDSAVGIEQCRAYTKEKVLVEEKRLNEIYASSQPKIVELAASQNNGQTETIALKYGIITQKDIIRSADVFLELVNQGYPVATAQSMAASELSTYSAYLRSLHDWGVNEFKTGNATLKGMLDTYENQVYQACLSIL